VKQINQRKDWLGNS